MRGGVIRVESVHRQRRIARRAEGETEREVVRARDVLGDFLLVVRAVPEAEFVFHGHELGDVGNRAAPPHCVARRAGIVFAMVESHRGDLRRVAAKTQRARRRRTVRGEINPPAVREARRDRIVLAHVTGLEPALDVAEAGVGAGRDDAIIAVIKPRGPVADRERTRLRRRGVGGDDSAFVTGTRGREDVGVADIVRAVEGEIEIILNHLVRAEAGGGEGGFPILVVRTRPAVGIKRQLCAAPSALRKTFVKQRAASLVRRAVGVVRFLDAGINRDGVGGAEIKLRAAHVDAQVAGVVGNVPGIGEHGAGVRCDD